MLGQELVGTVPQLPGSLAERGRATQILRELTNGERRRLLPKSPREIAPKTGELRLRSQPLLKSLQLCLRLSGSSWNFVTAILWVNYLRRR